MAPATNARCDETPKLSPVEFFKVTAHIVSCCPSLTLASIGRIELHAVPVIIKRLMGEELEKEAKQNW
jgi:hypothetical protein